ncbi:hypothetical protein Pvag_1080 [Pantoea vagans C9-1]|nr:hypothetical protein Pvag_1080 [Pantoea vagans C9-1]
MTYAPMWSHSAGKSAYHYDLQGQHLIFHLKR